MKQGCISFHGLFFRLLLVESHIPIYKRSTGILLSFAFSRR
nr:MAG TPA: hypothetical protein [Caudoviricetes sp.]